MFEKDRGWSKDTTNDRKTRIDTKEDDVWWDWKGIVHYELLPPCKTIDSDLYSTTNTIEMINSRKAARIDR